jgi:hypothetical protein
VQALKDRYLYASPRRMPGMYRPQKLMLDTNGVGWRGPCSGALAAGKEAHVGTPCHVLLGASAQRAPVGNEPPSCSELELSKVASSCVCTVYYKWVAIVAPRQVVASGPGSV